MEELKEKSIIILEINLLLLLSVILGNNLFETIIIIAEFMIIRTIRIAIHYEEIYKCFITTIVLMLTNFLVLKANFIGAIITTCLSAVILSDRNTSQILSINIKNILVEGFMYKKSKYDKMINYRKKHQEEMQEFERRLKKYAPQAYKYYEMRVIKEMKYREIEKELGCDNRKITDQLNIAFTSFNTYFDIKDNELV